MKTLKGIAYDLKQWEIVHFENVTRKIKELRKDLHQLQKDPRAHNLRVQMKEIEDELHNLFKKEETIWHQRSRTNWIKDGDKNTSFFHRTTTGRKKRNNISRIRHNEGIWRNKAKEIETTFVDYFRNLTYGVESVLEAVTPKATPEINE